MDEMTKQIIGQVSGVLIQSIFSYLSQAGMSAEEIDTFFSKERAEFLRKHTSTLPPPSQRPEDFAEIGEPDPMPPELQEQWKEEHGES